MKLYVFTRSATWDEYEGFAITAKTIESAVAMRDDASYRKHNDWELEFCEEIDCQTEEVLLGAYNAG